MQLTALLFATSVALTGPQVSNDSGTDNLAQVASVQVKLKQTAEVSARDQGQLVKFDAGEGAQVEAGEWLGRIEDDRAKLQYAVAVADHKAATEEATNDVNIRFAEKSAQVAKAELDQATEANRRVGGAISPAEVRRRLFAWDRSKLQIEQAAMERKVAGFTQEKRTAEVNLAVTNFKMRQLMAPFDGEIVEIFKHVGEWVNPGDPVFRIVHLKELSVEGFVSAEDYLPADLDGRPVTVRARITGSRVEEFNGGYIEFVSPEVDPFNQRFKVKAIVPNRQENGHWLLRSGLQATMAIHLDGAPMRPKRVRNLKNPVDELTGPNATGPAATVRESANTKPALRAR